MISKSNFYNKYIGPKAIFDPNYIPPQILHRKKEENSLFSILKDSLSDNFCLNIIYQGIEGIGKKVIINKVLRDIKFKFRHDLDLLEIIVDCKEKNTEELILSLICELNKRLKTPIDLNSIIGQNISNLWNLFKLASNKINNNYILILKNTGYLKPNIFKKLLHHGKESNITIISTINKILRASTLDFLYEFDLKKKLDYYSYNELYSILKQRSILAFPHEIEKELIEFITDLIFEHFVPVPGKGINIYRDIYPILKNQNKIEHTEMLEICQNHFDNFNISDDFNMLSYIVEEDLLTVLFLDNLSNIFLNQSKFYISINELKEIYEISCESLDYEKNNIEFKDLIKTFQSIGIINPSQKTRRKMNYSKTSYDFNSELYFMTINPNRLKVIVDTIFNQLQSLV
ncbi:MAG: hypothetical protein ACTSQG_00745 [Promethearchaeota archaeon]